MTGHGKKTRLTGLCGHKILHVDDSRLLPFILYFSSRSFASHFGRSLWPVSSHCSDWPVSSQASELTTYRPLFQFAFCCVAWQAVGTHRTGSERRGGAKVRIDSTRRKAVVSNHCSSLESYCIVVVSDTTEFSLVALGFVRSKAKGYRFRRSQFLSLLFLRLLWLHICHWKGYVERKDAEFGT